MSAFHAGHHCKLMIDAVSDIDLPADKWEFEIQSNNKNATNSRDGRKRIAGLPDATGSFDLPYDSAADPTVTANGGIREGSVLAMKFFVDDTHFWAINVIVDSIGAGQEIEGDKPLMFPVKWSMESGVIVPPAYS